MPTSNRRIATYIPKEIDEKFQVFKQEREVGDSQALILVMSEYFGVSQQVTYSNDSPLVKQVEELSSLLSELKSELATKVGEERIGELKSELLSELKASSSNSELKSEPAKQLDIGVGVAAIQKRVPKPKIRSKSGKSKEAADGVETMTTAQLATRLKITNDAISKAKSRYKNDVDKFIRWSYDRDPEHFAWEFRSGSGLFYRAIPF